MAVVALDPEGFVTVVLCPKERDWEKAELGVGPDTAQTSSQSLFQILVSLWSASIPFTY